MLSNYHAYHGQQDRAFDYEVLLMRSDDLDVEKKVSRLYKFTSDNDFYVANYFRIGSLVQALAIKHPDHPKVVDLYSAHLLAAGENEQALDYLRRHLDDKAVTVDDYIFVMQLEHYMGLDELLFADLARALELYPTDFDLLTFAGFVYGDKVGSKRAIKIFKESLAVTEDSKQVSMLWGYIGDAYHEEGNDRRAFAAYDKALQYDPDNVLVLNNYAYFLSLLDRELERALTMSARAIYLEKDNASYLDTHAWVLHRLGRNDEAKSFMRQALSMGMQRDPSYLMHYGDILWALGEAFLAETYWEKAVENGFDAEEMERHKASLMR
jgi:tetratricopeptide (TPR) repeat protein